MSDINLTEIHDLLVKVAHQAGKMIMSATPQTLGSDTKKNSADLVTETDKAVEAMVTSELRTAYPKFDFIGEETYYPGQPLTDAPTFIVDPIDGTTNFVHAFPSVCISLGFTVGRVPTVGVIYNPFLNELWTAIKGQGSYLSQNGGPKQKLPLKASPEPLKDLSTCLVGVEWGSDRSGINFDVKVKAFAKLAASKEQGGAMVHSLRSMGSAALNLVAVAAGQLDVYWEGGCWAWDVAAAWCVLEEAGGIMRSGNPGEEVSVDCRKFLAGPWRQPYGLPPVVGSQSTAVNAAQPWSTSWNRPDSQISYRCPSAESWHYATVNIDGPNLLQIQHPQHLHVVLTLVTERAIKMLEYFTYKKVKKHQAEKKAREDAQTPPLKPVLSADDEWFIEHLVSEGTPPPLPKRPTASDREILDEDENAPQLERSISKGKNKENAKGPAEKMKKMENRFSSLFGKSKKDDKIMKADLPTDEVEKEEDDITRVLNDLNLSAVNNRALSLSKESDELMKKFTLVLKDLVNGVPTAYDDLIHLLDDSQGTLAKTYEQLPSFLKKLIAQLPEKWTSTLAPEILATAAEAQKSGMAEGAASAAAGGGFMGAAKGFLKPNGLKDLVTKPGAVAGLLKTIMNSLKLRWPAFMGTNVLLSLGLFVLLFFFWYCHKRGKEVRLAAEGKTEVVDSEGRIVELEDDPALESSMTPKPESRRRSHDSRRRDRSADNSPPRRRSHDSRRINSGASPKSRNHDSRRHDASDEASSSRRRRD
ncbi:hypothetical protein V498_02222 [Pseudogymnoascus sp. VKM F-4517 (FW-2822)]|nr:hypothetical protein V498_02222 [Pseudogymnoascus sp. VKM F-4517 (FW-2822)]